MKILLVIDRADWAIGHLAQSIIKFNPQHKFKVVVIPPRELGTYANEPASEKMAQKFIEQVKDFNPDVIDFEYWRLAGQLLLALPELHRYKIVLMHHNMRDKALFPYDWQNNSDIKDKPHLKIDRVLCHCNRTRNLMIDAGVAQNVDVIRYGFDHNYWSFSDQEPEELALGYAGRFVRWKGLKEIAEVANELKYPLQIMGKEDKADYWESIPKDYLKYDFLNCPDEERINFYRNITIFVQNSIDGYEEGPMPLMEAMACGVPVITTPAGQAGYEEGIFKNRENCLMVPFNDKDALKDAVQELMSNKELRKKLREGGWSAVKGMTEEKMAVSYSKVWNQVCYSDHPLASIILPTTFDRVEPTLKIIEAVKQQTYPNIELIIIFDENQNGKDIENKIKLIQEDLTLKILYTGNSKGYNLAKARNLGMIEAQGEILIFNDSRLLPDENAVMMFVEAVKNASLLSSGGSRKIWFFGDKGSQKQSFVENFSAVLREELINIGMFCERVEQYGGMSQEIRTRWSKNKGELIYLASAVAKEIIKASNTPEKKKDIIKSKNLLSKMYGNIR